MGGCPGEGFEEVISPGLWRLGKESSSWMMEWQELGRQQRPSPFVSKQQHTTGLGLPQTVKSGVAPELVRARPSPRLLILPHTCFFSAKSLPV